MQEPSSSIPSYNDSVFFEEYHLKTNDRLYIRVYSLDERMNEIFNEGTALQVASEQRGLYSELYTYLIDASGNIVLPYVGEVYIEGKTLRQAKDTLEKILEPYFYLNKVDVDVRVTGRYYSIIGQSTSGRFLLSKDKINIFQALAQAGDIGLYGNRSKIRILRETEDGVQIKEFDIRSKDIINSEFYYIEPNDVIYIRNMTEEVLGITHVTNFIGFAVTTFSFGLFIYNLIVLSK